jgi:sterol desaturase/sphingolipid hydroxylase (fatty acid hydroxylase superfamily)
MKLILSLTIPVIFVVMWLIEARGPARPYVPVKRWKLLGAVFFFIVMITASITPLIWSTLGLTSLRVFNLSSLGFWGYPIGLLLVSGIAYWFHRAEHRFNFLWRMTHQVHHSALRVDIPGAFYTHPLEVVVKSTLGILVSTVFLGLAPIAAALVSTTIASISLFQHWNIHTPRWLGLFIPRPEMHGLHHEFGIHARNFSDLPLWDIVFGTYANPQTFTGRVGFEPPAAMRIGAMLCMRDVNAT